MDIYSVYHIQDKPGVGPYVGCSKNLKRRAGEHGVSLKDLEILFQSEDIIEASLMEQTSQLFILGKMDGKYYHLEHTEDSCQKMSDAHRGVLKSPEHCQAISDGQRGRTLSPEWRQAISDEKRGQTPWNKGVSTGPHTEETKRKIGDGQRGVLKSVEHRQKIGERHRGRVYINNRVVNKKIQPDQLQSYLDDGWQRGRRIQQNASQIS